MNRLTRQAGGPPPGSYGGGPSLAPPPARSYGSPSRPAPLPEPDFDDEEEGHTRPRKFTIREEEEAVTGLALQDWAAQSVRRSSVEELAIVGFDRHGAEAQRDRALREAVERQQRMAKEIEGRRNELLRTSPELAQQLLGGGAVNANFARPNITYATGAAMERKVTAAKQKAITDAGTERAARQAREATAPRPSGPPLTPAARRRLAVEQEEVEERATSAAARRPVKKKPAAKKAAAKKAAPKKAGAAKEVTSIKRAVAKPPAARTSRAAGRKAVKPAPVPEPTARRTAKGPAAKPAKLVATKPASTAAAAAGRKATGKLASVPKPAAAKAGPKAAAKPAGRRAVTFGPTGRPAPAKASRATPVKKPPPAPKAGGRGRS